MDKEFETSIYWKIIYGAVAIAVIGLSIFLFFDSRSPAGLGKVIMPVILLVIAFGIIVNLIKRKIVISQYNIISTGVWGTRELSNTNVKGFRIGDKAIYIKPKDGYSKITIRDYISIGKSTELIECLKTQYTDLDAVEYNQEHEEILNDPNLGFSKEDREASFKKASQLSLVYNIVGVVLSFLVALLFKYNQIIDIVILLYPLGGIALISLSKGLIMLIAKKSSAHYQIFIGIYMPVIVLMIKSIVDYHIFQYENFWVPFIIIGIILFTVLFIYSIRKSNTLIAGQLIVAILIAFAYSYGSVIRINCNFDLSKPKIYTPIVLDQHIITGKKDSYYLNLGPWGTRIYPDDIQVDYTLYHNVTIGGHVNIELKKGLLNIPWFYLQQ